MSKIELKIEIITLRSEKNLLKNLVKDNPCLHNNADEEEFLQIIFEAPYKMNTERC
jgi:hypothetical protein